MSAVNGVALSAPGEVLADEDLRERAWTELLRQQAEREGRLPARADAAYRAPTPDEERALQEMLEARVPTLAPGEEECRRYHAAHPERYVRNRAARVRHILFAVTPGVDVEALARRAEAALLELKNGDAGRFGELARTLSNCPSGADGGALGWLRPDECAPELAAAIFDVAQGTGLRPRLVHSRFGFHVLDVQDLQAGDVVPFEEVHQRVAAELALRARATALHQYIRQLAGAAQLEGVVLEAAGSPLVQ